MTPLERLAPALQRRARRLSPSEAKVEDLLHDTLDRLLARIRGGAQIDVLPRYAMRAWQHGPRPVARTSPH